MIRLECGYLNTAGDSVVYNDWRPKGYARTPTFPGAGPALYGDPLRVSCKRCGGTGSWCKVVGCLCCQGCSGFGTVRLALDWNRGDTP